MLEKPRTPQPPFEHLKEIFSEIEKETTASYLGYEYEKIIQTDSFKKWFEGSKAVDKNNQPLLMYNGAFLRPEDDPNMGNKFKNGYLATDGSNRGRGALGAYFTSSYASIDEIMDMNEGPGQNVITKAFLKIKNPIYVPKNEDISHMIDRMFPDPDLSFEEIKKRLQGEGYDGIIQNHRFGYYDDEYVAFDQDQILMLPNQVDPELDLEIKNSN